MAVVSSANVACGAHAGDLTTMREALARAADHGVTVGAHPGYRGDFGRVERHDPVEAVVGDVVSQVEALLALGPVAYVKLHGALYHRANREPELAGALIERVESTTPIRCVLAQPGALFSAAVGAGWSAVREGFCDRAYRGDELVDRYEPGAVLYDEDAVVEQALRLAGLGFESLCVHGDTSGAVALARQVRARLETEGYGIAPFA